MLLELSGFFAFLVAIKYISGSSRSTPPHVDALAGMGKDGPFHVGVAAMRRTMSDNIKFWTYPLLDKFGLKINMFLINDPADAREIMHKNELIHGHEEMFGWWDLLTQYRKLTGGKKGDTLNAAELGLMSDHDPVHKPERTKTAKLGRKRVLELLSKKQFESRWVGAVENEKLALEENILKLGKNGTVAFNPFETILHRVLSVLLQFALGQDLESRPGWLEEMASLIQEGVNTIVRLDTEKLVFISLPYWVRNWIPLRFWPKWCVSQQVLYDRMIEMIEEHNEHWKPGDEVNSLIGQWEEDRSKGLCTESDVIHSMHALMLAGADTISTGLQNLMINLARFPAVQEKCYNELKAINFQAPNLTDAPYLLATCWESLRYTAGVYRTLFHSVTEPTEVLGYGLKKGDLITVSLNGINLSEKYFHDPYKFNPDRFIIDGVFHKDENLMAFGTGRRSCPGQILAIIEVFHFAKNFLHMFEMKMDPNIPIENRETEEGFDAFFSHDTHEAPQHHFLQPKELRIKFVPRKD